MKQPKTPREWQVAVDHAAAARALADYKMYGLIAGGPEIDVARCDQLLAEGRQRGVEPSRPVGDLTVEMFCAINEDIRAQHEKG